MMHDNDDLFHVLSLANPTTWPGAILWLLIIVATYVWIQLDADTCSQMVCSEGHAPAVIDHECLCVERATVSP